MNRILIVNDDGINSPRIHYLAKLLEEYGDVTICCPCAERSAYSHAISIRHFAKEDIKLVSSKPLIYTHPGTPADSVRYMYDKLNLKFDYVFSGINRGYNLGVDIVYSGTVGAALEGSIYNAKSVALSASWRNEEGFKAFLPSILDYLFNDAKYPYKGCLNINFPDNPVSNELKWCNMAVSYNHPNPTDDTVMCKSKGFITITPIGLSMTIKDFMENTSNK